MECVWVKITPSLTKGVQIINNIEDEKFEKFARRVVAKMKLQDKEIFSTEEKEKLLKIFKIEEENLQLAVKSILYLFKRLLKYIFMPSDLKKDLKFIGLNNEKSEVFIKLWSAETRSTLDNLGSEKNDNFVENTTFSWKLNAELSSDYHKKCKIAKGYLELYGDVSNTELELTHPELYSVYLQLEAIQNELDNL